MLCPHEAETTLETVSNIDRTDGRGNVAQRLLKQTVHIRRRRSADTHGATCMRTPYSKVGVKKRGGGMAEGGRQKVEGKKLAKEKRRESAR